MNIKATVKNIQANCEHYIDPELVATVIHDSYYMGSNNIMELESHNIEIEDNFEKRIVKILNEENVFLAIGMISFVPVINECDIYSTEDYTFKLSPDEFEEYSEEKEKFIGILIKKNSTDYVIGYSDLCNCSIDASFKEIRKTDTVFYKNIEKIINSKIID